MKHIYITELKYGSCVIAKVEIEKETRKQYKVYSETKEFVFSNQKNPYTYINSTIPKDSPDVHTTLERAIQRLVQLVFAESEKLNNQINELNKMGEDLQTFITEVEDCN